MRYIFSALIALSLIAVTAHDRLDNRAEARAIEPALTDPSGQAQEGWAEKLFPEGLSHDFGTVPRGTQSFYKFKMKNIFSEPLELTLRISCGCVTAKPSVQILEPLQEGTIDVLMDAKKYQGPKTVTVEVTVGPKYVSTARLTVTGNCRMDVVLNPGQFNFGNILPGQRPGSQSLDVEYAGNADWRITGLD